MRAYLVSTLFILGCHKQDSLPCWVSAPCDPYMSQEYMLGVGSGESQKIADDEAIAEISKKFQAQSSSAGITTEESSTVFGVSAEISGIKIASQHMKGTRFYALAVLERAPLLGELDKELKMLEAKAENFRQRAETTKSKVDRAHYYHKAIPFVEKMQILNQRRVVVDYERKNWDIQATPERLKQSEDDALRSIKISVSADPGSEELLLLMTRSLETHGFSVTDKEPDLNLKLTAQEGMVPPEQVGFSKTRVQLHYAIRENGQENRVLFEQKVSGEAASQNLFKSREMAITQIEERLMERELGIVLRGLILGESR